MTKKIPTIFVLALVTFFAAVALLLVCIGAKQHRYIMNVMNQNYEERTTFSYLTEKLRQSDCADDIAIVNLEGVVALSIDSSEEADYTTYIYYYEGALRELVVTEDSVYSLSAGQEITTIRGFLPTFVTDSLLQTEITNSKGEKYTLFFSIRSNSTKEEL